MYLEHSYLREFTTVSLQSVKWKYEQEHRSESTTLNTEIQVYVTNIPRAWYSFPQVVNTSLLHNSVLHKTWLEKVAETIKVWLWYHTDDIMLHHVSRWLLRSFRKFQEFNMKMSSCWHWFNYLEILPIREFTFLTLDSLGTLAKLARPPVLASMCALHYWCGISGTNDGLFIPLKPTALFKGSTSRDRLLLGYI